MQNGSTGSGKTGPPWPSSPPYRDWPPPNRLQLAAVTRAATRGGLAGMDCLSTPRAAARRREYVMSAHAQLPVRHHPMSEGSESIPSRQLLTESSWSQTAPSSSSSESSGRCIHGPLRAWLRAPAYMTCWCRLGHHAILTSNACRIPWPPPGRGLLALACHTATGKSQLPGDLAGRDLCRTLRAVSLRRHLVLRPGLRSAWGPF